MNDNLSSVSPKVAEVLKADFTTISESTDLKHFNEQFRTKHKDSPSHVLSAILVEEKLGGDKGKLAKELVDLVSLDSITLEEASDALQVLQSWRSNETETFKKAATAKWPEAAAFA